jgi:precorrin-6Y C5,15-methyltransferase (decarboxylating)
MRMADPWLTVIGMNEDGLDGLSTPARAALARAAVVFGGPRHLELADVGARGVAWPVPFSVADVLARRGEAVVILASGDPFWYGAGGSVVAHLTRGEWVSHPAPSTFSLVANGLGWPLESTVCLGLHAAGFEAIGPHLMRGARVICLVRDGAAAGELAAWLCAQGAGLTRLHVMERLGGPRARVRDVLAQAYDFMDVYAPVAVGLEVGDTVARAVTPGLPDTAFAHDGQITKQAMRALTLCALAPRRGEVLWDIGAGSGSISVEWCLQGGRAVAMEGKPARATNIAENIARFGLAQRMILRVGRVNGSDWPELAPDAVFIGGGANDDLLAALWARLPSRVRVVINGVTLETEVLLAQWQARKGGTLLRVELAQAAALGTMRAWTPARPVVQWSVTT